MKTLADWKRLIKPGQKWHTFHHVFKKDLGIREVASVRPSQLTFHTERGQSHLYWPKAKEFKVVDDKTVQIYEDGVLVLTYRLVE